MSEKHTPGPWMVEYSSYAWDPETGKDIKGWHVCTDDLNPIAIIQLGYVGSNKECADIQAANARLIAAAPDLLEALQYIAIISSASINDCQTLDVVSERAREAIAKAIGSAPPTP